MKIILGILGACLVAATSFLATGCGGSNFSGSEALPDPKIMFMNASMDSGPVDYFLNEDLKSAGLGYLTSSNDFVTVPFIEDFDGAYDVSVLQSGATVPVDSINQVLERDKAYLVYSCGLLSFEPNVEKRMREAIIEVDRTKPVGNKARLIILHAFCRSAGNDTPVINLQTPGDNPLFKATGIAFGETSVLSVDSGKWTYEARRGDTSGTTIYAEKEVTLQSGGLYFVIVSGLEDAADPSLRPRIDFIQLTTKT